MIPNTSDDQQRQCALAAARLLLDCGAVRYQPDPPFQTTGGMQSPLHLEAHRVFAWPERRERLLRLALDLLGREAEDIGFDAVACGAEGPAIAFATLIADRMELPLLFVSRANDSHQRIPGVEGPVEPGARVLLVEPLATDGQRKGRLIQPLRDRGALVGDLLVIFQYGASDTLHDQLAPLGTKLHALTTWSAVLEAAREGGDLPDAAVEAVEHFLVNPARWHQPDTDPDYPDRT